MSSLILMTDSPAMVKIERIYKSGKSLCIIVPRGWIDSAQRKQGTKLTGVKIVTYPDHLEFTPYFGPKKRGRGKAQYINIEQSIVPILPDVRGGPDVH